MKRYQNCIEAYIGVILIGVGLLGLCYEIASALPQPVASGDSAAMAVVIAATAGSVLVGGRRRSCAHMVRRRHQSARRA